MNKTIKDDKNSNKNYNNISKKDKGTTETTPLIRYAIVEQGKVYIYNEKEQKLKPQASKKTSNLKSKNIISLTLKGNKYIYIKNYKK